MKHLSKMGIAIALLILIVNRPVIEDYLGFKKLENELAVVSIEETKTAFEAEQPKRDYLVNDSLYRWDEIDLDWVTLKSENQLPKPIFTAMPAVNSNHKPIKIDWSLLMEIEYNLKYYQAMEMKIYAPVFTESLIALDGKEVIIEGFVIPLDEEGEIVALSANPYAACFFCGKASPASVLSLYLKKKKLYKVDDFRKFRGTLKLNYNDPEEYYYILENAVPK